MVLVGAGLVASSRWQMLPAVWGRSHWREYVMGRPRETSALPVGSCPDLQMVGHQENETVTHKHRLLVAHRGRVERRCKPFIRRGQRPAAPTIRKAVRNTEPREREEIQYEGQGHYS